MTISEQAQRLLEKIKRKSVPVIVDELIEGHGYEATNHIVNSIQELRMAGILFTRSIMHKGRFETELYFEGQEESPRVKAKIKSSSNKPRSTISRKR